MTTGRIRQLIALAALVLAAIAFLSAVAAGFTAPGWVLPAGLLCLAIAAVIP